MPFFGADYPALSIPPCANQGPALNICAAFCVYVASLGPFHRGAAFIFYHQVAVSGLFYGGADMAKGKGMDAKDFVNKYGLDVEGSLDLRGTQITALPDNLTVG
ncbi:hypothetical protein LI170_02985, partial [Desulfovibrio desulfuricans]